MKKLIALCLTLALLLTVGCAPGSADNIAPTEPSADPTEPESVTEPPAENEDGTFGLSYLPAQGMNPYTCTAAVNRALFSLLYESLFVVSEKFRAEPVLCESFQVSDGGLTYTFSLPAAAKFSDGTPLTADDVLASIQAAQASSMYKARLSYIAWMTVQDSRTLIVRLDTPFENFALMLDVPIVKAATVESDSPVGTGAYILRGGTLIRNHSWWQGETCVLDAETIPLNSAVTPNDLRDAFEFGGTDLIYCDPNSSASGGYRCDYEAWEAPTTVMHYIGFNLGSGYFANNTLRTAVTYAINREKLCNEVYGGFARGSVLPCNPASDLYDLQLAKEYDYAPGKFAEAVSASGVLTSKDYIGYEGIFLVCSEDTKRVTAAERIAEALTAQGLNLRVSAVDRDTFVSRLNAGEFDLYYAEVRLTAAFDLSEFFTRYGALQYGSISSTALAALCTDALKNSGSYDDLYAQLLQNAPICPVLFKSYAVYVTRGKLTAITPALDCVFRNADTARTLSDADKTYTPDEPSESSDAASEQPEEP